jgi:hypothetical protein
MDRDGLCDVVERATGTRALRADTDGDGVPDGLEDLDLDGTLDPGETDPRVPGLFPGSYPHIPEPMVFDLVRGLGAKQGEVEVNTLALFAWHRAHRALLWAPEVEWAFLDGMAIELELPMHERELEAIKSALQVTLPMAPRNLTHGIQVIGEHLLSSRNTQATVLYIFGGRSGRWSLLTLGGARAITPMRARTHYEVLLNPSLYRDVTEKVTLGLEGNFAFGFAGSTSAAVIPQVHLQLSKRLRIQLGGGASLVAGRLNPLLSTRVILE